MKKSEIAKEKFNCYNCCQSVLFPYSEEFELPVEASLKLASAFGGGMGRGETCGAATGAYMVLGLKNDSSVGLSEAKVNIKAMVKKFNQKFIEKNGSLLCKDLIGYDLSIPEEAEKALKADVFNTICPHLVSFSVEVIENEF